MSLLRAVREMGGFDNLSAATFIDAATDLMGLVDADQVKNNLPAKVEDNAGNLASRSSGASSLKRPQECKTRESPSRSPRKPSLRTVQEETEIMGIAGESLSRSPGKQDVNIAKETAAARESPHRSPSNRNTRASKRETELSDEGVWHVAIRIACYL